MGKKIVVVYAGPRMGWNTETLISEAAKGAESAGAEIVRFDLFRLEKYTGCISCFVCKKEKYKGHCVCRDGLTPVLDAIRESDAYYINELKKHGIVQSMSRKGNCYDNCIMETFFGRMKNEMYYGYEKQYSSFEEFSKAVEEYIDYYNNKRIQAKTKWMPPVQYRIASMCLA